MGGRGTGSYNWPLSPGSDGRRRVAARYAARLEGAAVEIPVEAPGRRHVWHLYVARHAERDRLRAAARRTVEDRFSWQAVGAAYLRCYQALLEGNNG